MIPYETLCRLITACDFATFRQVAALYLRLCGFKDVSITDGWNDGGSDLRVCIQPPNSANVAVQTSVEFDWKAKAQEDAIKAKTKLKTDRFLFITSRRASNVQFERCV